MELSEIAIRVCVQESFRKDMEALKLILGSQRADA